MSRFAGTRGGAQIGIGIAILYEDDGPPPCLIAALLALALQPAASAPDGSLAGGRTARHPKVPMMAAGAPGQFAFASNDETAPAALLEDLPGCELETEFEHDPL